MYDIAYSIYIYTKLFYDTYLNTSVCHCGWTSGGEPRGKYVSAWLTELRGWSRGTREFDSRGAVLRVYRLTRFLTWQRYFNIVSPSVPYVESHTFWHEHAQDSIIRRGRHARFLANRIESATTWETRIRLSLSLSLTRLTTMKNPLMESLSFKESSLSRTWPRMIGLSSIL